jgi:hypothetical protein
LFVRAARVVPLQPQNWKRYGLKQWIAPPAQRVNYNKLAVALVTALVGRVHHRGSP